MEKEKEEIIMRKADTGDSKLIRDLLLNESLNWDIARINNEIESLYVLFCNGQLLGVFHACNMESGAKITWLAGHPMYPEDSVRTFMGYGLLGIMRRLPENRVTSGMKSCSRSKNGMLRNIKHAGIGFGIR